MQTVTLKAPAKINLYLKVLNKRPDGYHDIETVFEKIDLCDEITLKRRKRGVKVLCRHKGVPQDERNLGARAARALLKKTNRSDGVQIRITKRIPVASGLGGGSSDAASVLLGLNKLLGLRQSRRQLLDVAGRVGADVPFFILPAARAIGRGKGEILSPLRVKRKNWYVLVVPPVRVSTRRMYQILRMPLTTRPCGVKITHKYSYNSFEPVLRKKYKEIQEIKKALKSHGVKTTLVSGSGPCVFGIAKTGKEALDLSEKLRAKGKNWQVIVAKTYPNSKNVKEA
ncbi:MAG: 4-(cytidine 5'-diphospho)-2-C-methyl-D-erythritol kinase [Candidatus Omnitrophica bacterium]|nr:4-(cytidine 5'-diphospho)-2-C-methyl-D-erythritol kinase [Candidatus Omnitrophota bacterium]